MKDTFYFPHDYHAHKDPKCSALIKDFGFAGYGLYWTIVEILHEQGGKIKKFPKLFDGLAHQLNVDKDYMVSLLEALLRDYELLQQDQNCIWSERVLRNLEFRNSLYIKKAQAGRIGGLRSGASRCLKQNEALLRSNEPKEIKEKEIIYTEKHVFKTPSLEEVQRYCLERGNGINPQGFLDHYEANGWVRGKTKVKDWKACVRTWEGRNANQPVKSNKASTYATVDPHKI